ncbi:MAG TPA: hypothetical protein VK822_03120 [Acetobacteraceae bacterium]|jgi:hypothetical protein|nr:hypothetical protein [Acetobacteraceae bacterium]
MKYAISQTGRRAFRVGVARDGSDTDHCLGYFGSLREAQLFVHRMQVVDVGRSHEGSGQYMDRASPAALRALSRVLLAHAKQLRADAEKARERAVRSRLQSEQAQRSSVTRRAFNGAAADRHGTC